MELFIPSLIVLVLSAIVLFVVLPRMSPYTLGMLAIGLFVLGVWQHRIMFPYEYGLSSMTTLVKDFAPFLMLIAVILGGLIVTMVAFGKSPPSIASIVPASIVPASILAPANVRRNTNMSVNLGQNVNRSNIASTSYKVV